MRSISISRPLAHRLSHWLTTFTFKEHSKTKTPSIVYLALHLFWRFFGKQNELLKNALSPRRLVISVPRLTLLGERAWVKNFGMLTQRQCWWFVCFKYICLFVIWWRNNTFGNWSRTSSPNGLAYLAVKTDKQRRISYSSCSCSMVPHLYNLFVNRLYYDFILLASLI